MHACVHARVCVCETVSKSVCACMRARVNVCVCVRAYVLLLLLSYTIIIIEICIAR